MIGQKLGRYRIVEKLGAGGMGEVFRAHDDSLDRDVALKVLPDAVAADPERRRRFEREAKTVASLQHPNIVTIHSVEEVGGVHFLTMELVKGCTLERLIPTGGLTLDRLFELAVPLADAVHAAHEQGVIHRDLKPGNVMVDESGRLRVLDFGLAKLAESPGDGSSERTVAATESATQEGKILGTVTYMSPEQAEGKALDRRSDVFSLGVVLYEMATGKRPFEGDTPISTISSILKDPAPPVTSLKPLPRHLGRIIQRCLEKSPDKRFQTARDVCNELEGLKKEVESGDMEVSVGVSAPGGARGASGGRGRSTPLWAWLSGAVVVLAAAVVYLVMSGPGRETAPLATRPLTGTAGVEFGGSWSPDGSFFAYSHSSQGPLDIFVQATVGGDPILLVQSPSDDQSPCWSPDNRSIAFLSNRDGTTGIYLVPPLGGPVRKLVDTGLEGLGEESYAAIGAAPWSPDGRRLVFGRKQEGAIGLWVIDLESGAETQISHPAPDEVDGQGSWSLDGERIVFVRWKAGTPSICAIPAQGGKVDLLTASGGNTDGPLPQWSPDGKSVLFISNREGGIGNLWLMPSSGGAARRLTSGSTDISAAAVARDGRILYSDFSHQTDLYLQDVGGTEARRLTFNTQTNFGARISPQNDRVVYSSDRTGDSEVWVLDLATGTEHRIVESPAQDWSPDWSPDGRSIVFISDRSGSQQAWVVDAGGGMPRLLTEQPGAQMARWTPDGSGIGLVMITDQGLALWLVDESGGDARRVLDRVLDFDWYRDSRRVVYTPADSPTEIRAVDLQSGETTLILSEPHLELDVAPDGSSVTYCAAASHFNMNLQLLHLEGGDGGLPMATSPPEALARGQGLWHVHNGGWAPDGRSVVYTRDTDTGDIYLLDGAF